MEILSDFTTSVKRALGEINPDYEQLDGLVICGSHTPILSDVEGLLEKIRDARENGRPFLGICYGHQLCAIEYARNVLGIKKATSEEFGKGTFVVKKRKEMKVGLHEGESYWSNYETVIDWTNPRHFVTASFHPEYQSRLGKPHPLLAQFLNLCSST